MDLILKSSTSDYLLADVGVVVKAGAGSTFSNIPPLIRALAQSSGLRARVIAGTTIVNNGAVDLNAADGQRYLNQLWLMSGNDVSPQMSQVEGVISDTQHGSRSGRTLHSAVVAGVSNGFMTAADKTKLDGVVSGIFGANYQKQVDDTRTTTTANAYGGVGTTKLTLVTPALTGMYRVAAFAVLDQGAANQIGWCRLYNSTDAVVLGEANHRPSLATVLAPFAFRCPDCVFAGAAKTFLLQFRSGVAGDTTGCQYARIEIWRVS